MSQHHTRVNESGNFADLSSSIFSFFVALFLVFTFPFVVIVVIASIIGLAMLPMYGSKSYGVLILLGAYHLFWGFWSAYFSQIEHAPIAVGTIAHIFLFICCIFSGLMNDEEEAATKKNR